MDIRKKKEQVKSEGKKKDGESTGSNSSQVKKMEIREKQRAVKHAKQWMFMHIVSTPVLCVCVCEFLLFHTSQCCLLCASLPSMVLLFVSLSMCEWFSPLTCGCVLECVFVLAGWI